MANIRFCWDNAYTAAGVSLDASSELSAMPVTMTQNTDRSNVWRSDTDTTVQTIAVDLAAVVAVSAFCVANAKMIGTAGTIELYQCGDGPSPGAATLVATVSAVDAKTRAAAAFFATQSHRHWLIKFTNPTVANDYAELGYAFLGTYTEPEFNPKFGIPQSRQDPSQASMSVDGQMSFALRSKYHQGSFSWDAIKQTQLEQLQDVFDEIGVAVPLFIVLDTAISWMCWFARLGAPAWDIEPQGSVGRFSPQIPWTEVR